MRKGLRIESTKVEGTQEGREENISVEFHILALEDGTEIHMLVERRYPLIRETLKRMMELRLTDESEVEAVFDLLKFIQKD
ncbi:hypothetical protein Tco_0904110 [Tanacetum coccineum]